MNAVEIIAAKRDREELSDAEIEWLVSGFVSGDVTDYQMAAFAMAVFLNGMSSLETASLTRSMLGSGTRLVHSGERPVVDKHSTGGVGDKTSLVLAPLLACCDVAVPMLSGRGLGPTGGTLDKLEAIPGFRTDLSISELQVVVDSVGCVITGASAELAPADRMLYALRDVTATVPSIPLITASIMSKKLAESPDALVLDVKFGSGAFMPKLAEAKRLAASLTRTGTEMGLPTLALLSDMNQPLGRMCGNALEVSECLKFLRGDSVASDLAELTFVLASELLQIAGGAENGPDRSTLEDHISSGRAMERFEQMVIAQGGDAKFDLKTAPASELAAQAGGYVTHIETRELGEAIIDLGGGRRKKTDRIDHSTGIEMLVRLGDSVDRGQPLVRVYARGECDQVSSRIRNAIRIAGEQPEPRPLIPARIRYDGAGETDD